MKAWACALALCAWSCGAAAADLRIAVDASTEMPWADRHDNTLTGGLHFDVGQALADELGRQAHFLLLPRKRLTDALTHGDADIACGLRPSWLPGPFDWTHGFMSNADVVLTLLSSPAPTRLRDLAGQPIGTINGFAYPELADALGTDFVRDDAPSAVANLGKLAIGRVRHAIVNQRLLDYQQQHGMIHVQLHPPLVIHRDELACAVSRHGQVTVAQLEQAIRQLSVHGRLHELLTRAH